MPERDILALARQDWKLFAGCWVNHVYILDAVPGHWVRVVLDDGSDVELASHPKWPAWCGELGAGEFYSHIGTDPAKWGLHEQRACSPGKGSNRTAPCPQAGYEPGEPHHLCARCQGAGVVPIVEN